LIIVIFTSAWVGITLPILLSLFFALTEPILLFDNTGLFMLITGIIIAFIDGYIGLKIYEKIIRPLIKKRI